MDKIRSDEYNKIKTVLSSDRIDPVDVCMILQDGSHYDIHAYFCKELPERPAVCSRCEALLKVPLQREEHIILQRLLRHGAYPSEDICAAGYRYNHLRAVPLKVAVQSRSLDHVRQLLSQGAADDVNAHPRFCVGYDPSLLRTCADCDTPLMAAVRREDIAMMRLLIAHGASVSEEVHGYYGWRPREAHCSRKTALLVALHTENEEVITELMTSGADVNQSLGPIGTALHFTYEQDSVVRLLIKIGANPNATNATGRTALSVVLSRCVYQYYNYPKENSPTRKTLRTLLPVTRDLDAALQKAEWLILPVINNDSMTLFLQHGATIQ